MFVLALELLPLTLQCTRNCRELSNLLQICDMSKQGKKLTIAWRLAILRIF